MSQENVDRFTQTAEAFNRLVRMPPEAPERDLRTFLSGLDPMVQFEPRQAALQGGYVGHDGVVEWLADLSAHYDGGHIEYADVSDRGDQVLAVGTLHFIGKGSGIETDAPVAVVARFRDGLITHFKDYGDQHQALEAVGLSE